MDINREYRISPSLMCMDFLEIKKQLDIFVEEKIDYLHIDIMDGHYVPNFTLGVDFCNTVYSYSNIPLDIHLMIDNPENFIDDFSLFKNSIVSIHPDVYHHPVALLQKIRDRGIKSGIAVDPYLTVEQIYYLLPYVDQITIMTVNPGYAGQRLIEGMIEKIKKLVLIIDESGYRPDIEVDGNVSWENLPAMLEAGGNVFVAGTSSIFKRGTDLREGIRRFRKILDDFKGGATEV